MNIKMTIAFAALLAALTAAAQETTIPSGDMSDASVASDLRQADAQPDAAPADAQPAPEAPATPASPETLESPASPSSAETPAAPTTDEIDLEEDDSALAASRPQIRSTSQTGPVTLVDIDCDDATLADILRQFRKTTGANIISSESTNLLRRVSASLRRVPWFQALTEILNARGFRLDERDGVYRVVEDKQTVPLVTKTFQLNHASAKELAELFNKAYAPKDKSGKPIAPIANYFDGANVVVVTAEEKTISDCVAIVKAVDRAVAQIYIEARFLELSSAALHKLGLDWSSLESWGVTAKNLKMGWEQNYGRLADYSKKTSYSKKKWVQTGSSTSDSDSDSSSNSDSASKSSSGSASKTDKENYSNSSSTSDNTSLSSSTSKSKSTSDSVTYTDLADGTLSFQNDVLTASSIGEAAGAGLSAASMGWANASGFAGQLSADDFKLALSAFEEFGEGKIFSNPRIIVSNGKQAKVDMTTKEPNVTVSSSYTGTSSQNLSISTQLDVIPGEDKQLFAKEAFFSYGIELTVTPRISPDGLITVEIVPTISEKTGDKEIAGSTTSAPYTSYPIINVKRLTTEFTMKSGSTAVIGGLSRTVENDVDSGIPYLREIPWIGQKLFGWKSRQKQQSEILICVTLGIANPENLPEDLGLPKNAVLGREYVEGKRLEPGDRKGSAAEALKIDMRSLDEQRKETDKSDKASTVKISISSDDKPAKETKPNVEIKPSDERTNVLSDIDAM